MGVGEVTLRPTVWNDIGSLYRYHREPEAIQLAAFASSNTADRSGFEATWRAMLADSNIVPFTIVLGSVIVGDIIGSTRDDGRREVSYWIGRSYWHLGIATDAMMHYLDRDAVRPLYARTAVDNTASARVLMKCGFVSVYNTDCYVPNQGRSIATTWWRHP